MFFSSFLIPWNEIIQPHFKIQSMRYVKVKLMKAPSMITQSQSMRDVAVVFGFELERLRQYPMVQDLLCWSWKEELSCWMAAVWTWELAWPRCFHEGCEVLPKALTTHASALYYRHDYGYYRYYRAFFHIQKIWVRELVAFFFSVSLSSFACY